MQAKSDLASAYNAISSDSCGSNLTGQNLGGLTLTPGVYCFSSSALLTGTLTLNSQADNSAVFIFKIGSALTTASSSSVLVKAGGDFCNVFWQVGSSAVLGTNTAFAGNILAFASITLAAGASLAGGALARNGAVTMDTTHLGACPTQPAWTQKMHHTFTPGPGCFYSPYPSTVWQRVPCGTPVNRPPPSVGHGVGDFANAGSPVIGYAQGSFGSVFGIMTEGDSAHSNPTTNKYYSLQLNSNAFTCMPPNGVSATCWQQFLFYNFATGGQLVVVYYLPGYFTNNLNCIDGTWGQYPNPFTGKTDCIKTGQSSGIILAEDPTTQLGKLTLSAQSNEGSSGTDSDTLCDGSGCNSAVTTGTLLSLYNHWNNTEFNIFGYGGGSTASFNSGTSLSVDIYEENGSGSLISSSCASTLGSYSTAEQNNLGLGTCTPTGTPLAHITFSESN